MKSCPESVFIGRSYKRQHLSFSSVVASVAGRYHLMVMVMAPFGIPSPREPPSSPPMTDCRNFLCSFNNVSVGTLVCMHDNSLAVVTHCRPYKFYYGFVKRLFYTLHIVLLFSLSKCLFQIVNIYLRS